MPADYADIPELYCSHQRVESEEDCVICWEQSATCELCSVPLCGCFQTYLQEKSRLAIEMLRGEIIHLQGLGFSSDGYRNLMIEMQKRMHDGGLLCLNALRTRGELIKEESSGTLDPGSGNWVESPENEHAQPIRRWITHWDSYSSGPIYAYIPYDDLRRGNNAHHMTQLSAFTERVIAGDDVIAVIRYDDKPNEAYLGQVVLVTAEKAYVHVFWDNPVSEWADK